MTSAKIEEDADFAVLDKNVYIATVSEGGKLELEMRVKNGRGYVAADRNFDEDLPIGYIPMDSVHSPVRKVNYAVEAARLGQMTDYEKLTLEVWTNGAITPQDAIGLAAKLDQGPHEHLHQLRRDSRNCPKKRSRTTTIRASSISTAPSRNSSFPCAPTIA